MYLLPEGLLLAEPLLDFLLEAVSLREKDLKFVSEGMEGNRSLEELNLSKNEI